MQFSLKSAIAASVLTLASSSAFALALTQPYESTGSSVTLLAFDSDTSYLIDLGETYDSMYSDIQGLAPGGTLTYVLPGFGAAFGLPSSQPGGSYGAGIRFGVVGGKADTFDILNTATIDPPISDDRLGSIIDGSIQVFYGRSNVGCGGAPAGAPCITAPIDTHWGGEPSNSLDTTYFGDRMLDQLLSWDFAAQSLDSALTLYRFSLDDGEASTDESLALGEFRVLYSAALGSWTAEFSTVGAPVPLPAAVWLLLSGLAGLGVVGRRKGAGRSDA